MCRNDRYRERGIKEFDGDGAPTGATRARVRREAGSGTGAARRLDRNDQCRRQGLGADRPHPVPGLPPGGDHADHWRGTHRAPGSTARRPASLEVHIVERVQEGTKPELARMLGASYHTGRVADVCRSAEPDVVLEATGVPELWSRLCGARRRRLSRACSGSLHRGRALNVDVGALDNELVLENDVVFGSVNGTHRHIAAAAKRTCHCRSRMPVAHDHPPRSARRLDAGSREAGHGHQDGHRIC
jgi:glucose 1-dehydrogenase